MTTVHKCPCGHPACDQHTLSTQGGVGFRLEDAMLYAAAEDLREALRQSTTALSEVQPFVSGKMARALRVQIEANNAIMEQAA